MTGKVLLACCMFVLLVQSAHTEQCRVWPAWDGFRDKFMSAGRIIDPSSPRKYTTSEGQSYALFFALVANDRKNFDNILDWTEQNLAQGNMAKQLPAWEWGKRDDGGMGILDDNSAADSDLWIAYTLSEAGELWKDPKYSTMAKNFSDLILKNEAADIPGLGWTLIPGAQSFHPKADLWRLNPSYVPLQLVRKMAALYPDSEWPQLVPTSIELIARSSPVGFAPDWVIYRGGFLPDSGTRAVGSFNAIRVYLWAGMLDDEDPVKKVLLQRFSPMQQYVSDQGTPPLDVDTRKGSASGIGPGGFSAALIPFLADSPQSLRAQRLRVVAKAPLSRSDNYYDQALTLFGLGWIEKHYRFSPDGSLIPDWTCGQS